MSQLFDEKGNVIPITWVRTGESVITQLKDEKKDGYSAVQVGFEPKKEKKVKKTEKGKGYKYLREYRLSASEDTELKEGDKRACIFSEGDLIKVVGITKAKGHQGVVKRWGFAKSIATHGTKHETRKGGSIGIMGAGKVFKGKKMEGRTGGKRSTVNNLKIVKVDKENNLIALKGAVPGNPKGLVEMRRTIPAKPR